MHPVSPCTNKLLTLFALLAMGFSGFAQAPNLLNYQGVARNALGNPLPNQAMTIRLSIRNNSDAGPVVYSETRTIKTNLGGLFVVQIGSAGVISTTGSISGIKWQKSDKYIQVEIAPKSDNNFIDLGIIQLATVPYSFNAVTADTAATVTTNANLTGVITSVGNVTSFASSPALTGVPTAPTAAVGTANNQIATTAFVTAASVAASTGAEGPVGPVGAKGAIGIQGATGSAGATGDKGAQGIQGIAGSAGAKGDIGVTGASGAQGITGSNGSNGVAGSQGIQGLTGAKGDQGIQGATGTQGIQGVAGSIGINGAAGVKGDTGAQGIQGATGATGSATNIGTLPDLTVTNPIVGSVTGNAATVTTNATLTGDVMSVGNATIVKQINGIALSGLATGILKNTTTTGVPSIAVAGDFPTLNQSTSGNAATATNLIGLTTSVATLNNVSGLNSGDQTNIIGNAATVTINANLTGVVTSTGNASAIANAAITNSMLANGAVANLSGTNTGDQTLPTLISLGAVASNLAITGATNTKITYDAKGLITSGAAATTADIAASTNKNYVTDAQQTVIGNTSGTNTGDNSINSLYSGLVSNETHTGDATGSTALTVVKINGTLMSGLATGILKNTTTTGVPSIAIAGTDFQAPITLTTSGSGVATFSGNTLNIPSVSTSVNSSSISGTISVANGGTGATTKAAGFDALSPMSTSGDIIYGGASGTGTRLGIGLDGQLLSLQNGLPYWSSNLNSSGQIIDVDQTSGPYSGDAPEASTGVMYQTFTAISSGTLSQIHLASAGSASVLASGTIGLYNGVGTAGTLISTTTFTNLAPVSVVSILYYIFYLPNPYVSSNAINIIAGSTYTFKITFANKSQPLMDITTAYGTSFGTFGIRTTQHFKFKTFISKTLTSGVDYLAPNGSAASLTNFPAFAAAAATLTGTTLASTVVSSSLTSVGTIISGAWNGTTIAIAKGGTGTTTGSITGTGALTFAAGGSNQNISIKPSGTGSVGVGTSTPASSAELEVSSTTKGFLPPRMAYSERQLISSPATGLMIYCTDCGMSGGEPQFYNGSEWVNLIGGTAKYAVIIASTTPATKISSTTATSGGNISSDGGNPVIARGVCWNTSPNPTIANPKTTETGTTGSYTSTLTGLTSGVFYYIRSYVSNDGGTTYGKEISYLDYEWLPLNLAVTTYRDGTSIPEVTDNATWAALTTGAWCYYNNDATKNAIYGKLYNYYVIDNSKGVCPVGWHIPSEPEWQYISYSLGGDAVSGGTLKATGTTWPSPNTATNSSGFAGVPGGFRGANGTPAAGGYAGWWWTSIDNATGGITWGRKVVYNDATLVRSNEQKTSGFSIRCLKD
jgi:uncharacterized protein (TIGR02145 family)